MNILKPRVLFVALVLVGAGSLSVGFATRSAASGAGARARAAPLRLPAPTGPFSIGTRVLMLVDSTRVDPFDPRHRHRRLMVQIWYPAASRGPLAAYIANGVGRIYAAEYGLAVNTFTRVRTNAHRNARPLERPGGYPTIVFSPGYGVPHTLCTSLLEDLASHGFVVLALDHTYETDAVEFPGGRIVRRNLPPDPGRAGTPTSYRLLLRIIGQRVADVRFLRRRLPALDERIGHIIDFRRVEVFGHSLGGLTTANALEADRALRAGVDLDGSIYGPGVRQPLDRPFMIMTGHGDGTMLRFWPKLRGARLFVRIDGTRHLNYSDWNVLAPWLSSTHVRLPVLGAIRARRALRIERAYLDSFFARHLGDVSAPLLDSPSPFPQVHLMRLSRDGVSSRVSPHLLRCRVASPGTRGEPPRGEGGGTTRHFVLAQTRIAPVRDAAGPPEAPITVQQPGRLRPAAETFRRDRGMQRGAPFNRDSTTLPTTRREVNYSC